MDDAFALAGAKLNIPVDVHGLARRLGIYVKTTSLPDNQSGYIKKEVNGSFTVGLNREDGELRQRFTLAHELGHYYLHSDLLEPGGAHFDRLYSGHNDSGLLTERDEAQANQFAAELLMPKSQVRRTWNNDRPELWQMAKQFGVSKAAMAWRLFNLKLAEKHEVNLR